MEYDIRRSVRLRPNLTVYGSKIMDALKKVAKELNFEYYETLILDIDGTETFKVGLSSCALIDDISIRAGRDLENLAINPNHAYDYLGVGFAEQSSGMKMAANYFHEDAKRDVEKVRDSLEQLLKS